MECSEELWNTCYERETNIARLGKEIDTLQRNLRKIPAEKTSFIWDPAWDNDAIKAKQKEIDDIMETMLDCKPCYKWLGLRRKREISSIAYSSLPEFVKTKYAEKITEISAGNDWYGNPTPSRTEVTYVLKGGAKKRSTKSGTRKNRKRTRGTRTYRKQRGGGLKEEAIAALGTIYPDVLKKDNAKALEVVLFEKEINDGDTFTGGDFTFKKYKPDYRTYKIKAWKTTEKEENAVDIVDVRD